MCRVVSITSLSEGIDGVIDDIGNITGGNRRIAELTQIEFEQAALEHDLCVIDQVQTDTDSRMHASYVDLVLEKAGRVGEHSIAIESVVQPISERAFESSLYLFVREKPRCARISHQLTVKPVNDRSIVFLNKIEGFSGDKLRVIVIWNLGIGIHFWLHLISVR